MYPQLSAGRPLTGFAPAAETDPRLNELSKKMHFFRFLQKEINTAKTQAEKEAVLTILLKTRIQILALEREWKETQLLQRQLAAASSSVSVVCPPHRLQ